MGGSTRRGSTTSPLASAPRAGTRPASTPEPTAPGLRSLSSPSDQTQDVREERVSLIRAAHLAALSWVPAGLRGAEGLPTASAVFFALLAGMRAIVPMTSHCYP